MPRAFFIGVKAIIRNNGRILLLKKAKSRFSTYWELPGGRIDGNESVDRALKRELAEELSGIDIRSIGRLVYYGFSNRRSARGGLFLMFFEVEAVPKPKIVISKEHSEYAWVSPDEAEKRLNETLLTPVEL